MAERSTSMWRIELGSNEVQRATTREAVSSGAALTGSYLAMNAAAALIASFGLLRNSQEVIIGAMLIAMLYGPIVGVALGLAEANMVLLGRSLLSEVIGAAWVWIIGYAVGASTPHIPIGSEILSRTSPNVLDLLIALTGGVAGGFTYLSTGLAGVIVGVAIATALVPPLTACGILLARHLPGLAGGAFLLFLANFTAIAIGGMLILWLGGYRHYASNTTRRVLIPRAISFVLLAVLSVYLTVTLNRTIEKSMMENVVRKTVSGEVAKIPGTRFVAVTFAEHEGTTVAWVVVRTPRPLSPEQVGRLNDAVNRDTGSTVNLYVRSVITAETSSSGYIYDPVLRRADDP